MMSKLFFNHFSRKKLIFFDVYDDRALDSKERIVRLFEICDKKRSAPTFTSFFFAIPRILHQ
jgi:hypothetical protein